MTSPPLGRSVARASLFVLVALLVVDCARGAALPRADPAVPCPHSCRCFKADNLTAANCSSLTGLVGDAASQLRVLRLTGIDEHLSVRPGAFSNVPHLQQLYLDRLGLTSLHPHAFLGLSSLDTLSASHNALSDPDEVSRVLAELPHLRRLVLRGNNLGRDPILLPTWHSRTLKHLDIGRCKLSALPVNALTGLSHLRHVVLDGNFVRDFRATAFPKSIVSIDVSNNDIERFTLSEVSKLPHLDVIEIGGNPVRCSCELFKLSNDYNMNKAVVCASPKTLLGKNLLEVKKAQVCGHPKKVKREVTNDDYDYAQDEDLVPDPALSGGEDEKATNEKEEKSDTEPNTGDNEGEKLQSGGEDREGEKLEAEGDEEENREEENAEAEGDKERNEHGEPETEVEKKESHEEEKTNVNIDEEEKNEEENEGGASNEDAPAEEEKEPGETVHETETVGVDEDDKDVETVNNEETGVSNEEEGAHLKNADDGEGEEGTSNADVEEDTAVETVGDNAPEGEDAVAEEDKADEEEEAPKDVNEETDEGDNEDDNVVLDNADEKSEEEESEKDTMDRIEDVLAAEHEEEEAAKSGDEEKLKKFLGQTDDNPAVGEDEIVEGEAEENRHTADTAVSGGAEDTENIEEGGDENIEGREEGGVNEDAGIDGSTVNKNTAEVAEEGEEEAESVESAGILPSLSAKEESETTKETSAEDVEEKEDTKSTGGDEDEKKSEHAEEEDERAEEEGEDGNLAHIPEDIGETGAEVGDNNDEEAAAAKSKENAADVDDGVEDDVESTAGDVDSDDVDDGKLEKGAPFKTASAPFEETEKETADHVIPEAEDRENDLFSEDKDEPRHRHPDLEEEDNDDDVEAVEDDSGKIERTSDVGARAENGDIMDNVAEEEEEEKEEGAAGASEEIPEENEEENSLLRTSDVDKTEDNIKKDEAIEEEKTETDEGTSATDGDDGDTADLMAPDAEDHEDHFDEDETKHPDPEEIDDDDDGDAVVDRTSDDKEEKPEYTDRNEQDLGAARAVETDDLDYGDSDELEAEAAENVDAAEDEETEKDVHENTGEREDADAGDPVEEEEEEVNEDIILKENAKITQSGVEEVKEEDEDEYVESVTEGNVPDLIPGGSIFEAKGDHPDEGSGDEDGDGTEGDGTDSDEDKTDEGSRKLPGLVDDYDYEDQKEHETTLAPKEPSVDFSDLPSKYPVEGEEEEEEGNEEEEDASGAGVIPVVDNRGEDEEDSGEEEEGSGDGHSVYLGPATTAVPEEEDKEESSGDTVPIAIFNGDEEETSTEHGEHEEEPPIPPPTFEKDEEGEEEDEDSMSGYIPSGTGEEDETEAPIGRINVLHVDASVAPPVVEETEAEKEEAEEIGEDDGVEEESRETSDAVSERPSDRGRGMQPSDIVGAPAAPSAPAAPVSPSDETQRKEDLTEAESTAGESEGPLGNNLASYVVLGAIVVIFVALVVYAVVRCHRQKSAKGKNDADLENGGARELQDVSKPLINNHHPNGTAVGGEKQRLEDETREPLMTKEQEASLTMDPEDKIDAPKKQNGGVVPEVVVENRPASTAKTPTKTPPTTPVDVIPPAPANGKATTPGDVPVNGVNGAATPLVNGGTTPDAAPSTPPAPPQQQQPVSPGAVRVVAKELPDSVAKKPIIITNRGADPAQQV